MGEKSQTPKFRLENITQIPENIKEMMKEIIREISQKNNLQPSFARIKDNYSCDPYCECNTECRGHDDCNYCHCVSYCKCDDYCSVEGCNADCSCDNHNDCNCIFDECGCHTR